MARTGQDRSTDRQALIARYAAERDKRIRPDGNDQYIPIKGNLSYYLEDPYTPVAARDPKTDHVTFAFIGGGFAGLVTAARLMEAGVKDVRIIEKGGDFGGTWYWNRYPGAQCDTSAMIYVPLLEETGHQPREKYAHAPEILEQCQRIGRQYGLYDNALFHTEVTDLSWDGARSRWVIQTTRKGFVVAGTEYEADCIIYASGFEVGTEYTRRSGFDMSGREGLKLSEAWGEGMRTLHGIHSRGFPNAFFVQAFQGAALISNVPHNLADAAKTIAATVRHVLDSGIREVEVTQQAQDAWIELLASGPPRAAGGPDCTPGYYNNEGHPPSPAMRYNLGYPKGPHAFFRYMEKWRDAGTFDGLEFR